MYKYLFFDLDGTVTDSGNAICNSVRYALDKFNITDPDPLTLKKFIGPPLIDSFMDFYGFSYDDAVKATALYRENYEKGGMFEVTIYDGIVELIKEARARGYVVCLATSKPERYAKQILDHFGMLELFDLVAGATMDESRNKKHQVIAYALRTLKVTDTGSAVMIGDTAFDVLGAHDNNMDCIGVSFGFGSEKELRDAGAVAIADSAAQIGKILWN